MNDQLKDALADILKLLKEGAEMAGRAASEQLPVLVKEYLVWGLAEHAMTALSGLVFIILAYILRQRVLKAWVFVVDKERTGGSYTRRAADGLDEADYKAMRGTFGYALPAAATVAGAVIFWTNLLAVIKILVAPRVYLLEQVMGMVK